MTRGGRASRPPATGILPGAADDRAGRPIDAGETPAIQVLAIRDDEADIRVDGRVHVVPFVVQGSTVHFAYAGEIYLVDVGEKIGRAKKRHHDHSLSAPMPGVVLKILVAAGDAVAKGAPLIILEAMKMEHQITAPRDGTIASVNCKEGELVQPGEDLVTLQ